MSYSPRTCMRCDGIFMNQFYSGVVCSDCIEKAQKKYKKRKSIRRVSFLLFPVGFLLYFWWKDENPEHAKAAWSGAMTAVKTLIVMGILYFILINYLLQ